MRRSYPSDGVNEMTEISAMYEALDNMDDYALMANVKPIGPHKALTDAIAELEQLRQRVQELEKFHELDKKQVAYLFEERNLLTTERDKATQYWQIAEGRCDALMKQRDELLAAIKRAKYWMAGSEAKRILDEAIDRVKGGEV